MGPLVQLQRIGVCAGLCAAALLLPSLGRAADPVEQLQKALKIDAGTNDAAMASDRSKKVEAAMADLKTISQKRRAYFLPEWWQYLDPNRSKVDKNLAKIREEMEGQREKIGKALQDAIIQSAQNTDTDNQLALAILIAEIAEGEQPFDIKPVDPKARQEKFARRFSAEVVKLTRAENPPVRRAALHALGKITPDPRVALPILKDALAQPEVGPRRLAAYALVDLVKNANFHKPKEELEILHGVIQAAGIGLRGDNPEPDEPVRGYCMQAILESAKAFLENFTSPDVLVEENLAKEALLKETRILDAYKTVTPRLVQAIGDPEINIRLSALQALEQIANARQKIIKTVKEDSRSPFDKTPPFDAKTRDRLLKSFAAHDPFADILQNEGWRKIAHLLEDKGEDQKRLRRGVLAFFEQLGDEAAPAVEPLTDALGDPDRFVRLAATRTIRNLPPSSKAVYALAYNLLIDGDTDLSGAAAEALEAFGPAAAEAVPALGIIIANGGGENRSWDAENRVKAMKALVSIGQPKEQMKVTEQESARIKAAAQRALPQVLSALRDSDVRVRKEATATIGELGRPADAELLIQVLAGLKSALRDEDADVRLNASEAILSIAPRKK